LDRILCLLNIVFGFAIEGSSFVAATREIEAELFIFLRICFDSDLLTTDFICWKS